MGKAPAFQFYIKDWLSDSQLRLASVSTRGIWIDLICYMWWSDRSGKIELTEDELAKLTGANNGEIYRFVKDAEKYKFCNINVTRYGALQICNRRMTREDKARKSNAKRQKRYREKLKRNTTVTPPSPTPSPTPSNKSSFAGDNSKIKTQLKRIEKRWPKVHTWIGQQLKNSKNKEAIKHVLNRIEATPKIDDYYAFATRVMKVENGNYNEAEFRSKEIERQKEELRQAGYEV